MRKGIVLLIVALLYGCGVFARPDSKVPATDKSRPTVTLTQEQFDSLVSAASKSNQMKLIAKDESEKMFTSYTTTVGWIVALFGVIVGIVSPWLMINDIKKKIEKHEKTLSNYDTKLVEYNTQLNSIKEDAEKTAKEAKANALFARALHGGHSERAIELYGCVIAEKKDFWQAYSNRGNIYASKGENDKAIRDYTEAIRINKNDARLCLHRGYVYVNRGNDGDYELAMNDFKTGLSLNPDETTRKMLENNMEKLKAKMQKPKEDA